MPLIGFVSNDGKSDQPEGNGHCSFDYALQLCRDGDDDSFPYPYPLLKGIIESVQQRGEYISVTSILHCLRGEFLKRTEPYYSTVEAMYPMFRGTLFHGLMEANPHPDGLVEIKTIRKYKGIEIGGTYDSLIVRKDPVTKKFVLQDWKTTDNLPRYDTPYSSHIIQVNLYRWLLDLPVDETILEVHYFSMKAHKRTRLKDGTGPSRGGRAPSNQMWTDAQVESYLDDRLLKLKASYVTRLPMPYALVTEDEKWECVYCPVRQLCADTARLEAEATWRRRAGLPPVSEVGVSDLSPEWFGVTSEVYARIDAAYPKIDVDAPAPKKVVTSRRKRSAS